MIRTSKWSLLVPSAWLKLWSADLQISSSQEPLKVHNKSCLFLSKSEILRSHESTKWYLMHHVRKLRCLAWTFEISTTGIFMLRQWKWRGHIYLLLSVRPNWVKFCVQANFPLWYKNDISNLQLSDKVQQVLRTIRSTRPILYALSDYTVQFGV